MIQRWEPSDSLSKQEELLLHHVRRTRKLFSFLRLHRRELFDDEFQDELAGMYRGSGKPALAPGILAMATLLQGYLGVSDAEAVQLCVVDLRWQMVLGCLGAEKAPFSQGALHDFRARLIRTHMDRRLLERTVELARRSGAFDWKKLPKSLDVAIDSSPLEGCGRVEDTFNLLGHAARALVASAATLLKRTEKKVARQAGIPLLSATSIKAGLDIDWSDDASKEDALNILVAQLESLQQWIAKTFTAQVEQDKLEKPLQTLQLIREQNLEPSPSQSNKTQVRDGVAKNRVISVADPDMRHGRKSKTQRINGYKRHIATDLESRLIVACAVTPANMPEEKAGRPLKDDIERQALSINSLHIDRAYLTSTVVDDVLLDNGDVFCKPWVARNGKLFSKTDFAIDLDAMTITCPANSVREIERGMTVKFDADTCDSCHLRASCTKASAGRGRTVRIAPDEDFQQLLRERLATSNGRAKLRRRVTVEHGLAHIGARQGPRARYRGRRNNLFDLRRVAAIQNLETVHRWEREQKAA